MRISVIISTYNQPAWLEKSIWGFAAQTHRDFELVIADDGSTEETRKLIDRLQGETSLSIRHVWHEDRGFRKCTILNRATIAAEAEYLVFTDGDCIPRRDYLAQHARFAEPGYYLSGGIVRLPMALSRLISNDDIVAGRAHDLAWLRAQGLSWSLKHYKLIGSREWPRCWTALRRPRLRGTAATPRRGKNRFCVSTVLTSAWNMATKIVNWATG